MKYEYDNDGVYFAYFVWSICGLWLFPTTFSYLRHKLFPSPDDNENDKDFSGYNFQSTDTKPALRIVKVKKTWFQSRSNRKLVVWLLVSALFSFLTYRILTSTAISVTKEAFDPYQILGLSVGDDTESIKKQFKELSRQFHPDKASNDEERAEMEEKFIKISKAYKTLTDDDVRKNWEEYGDPDGRQSFSYGIALPTWIVDPSNKFFVLTVYALLFGVLLPVIVGKWWSGSKKYTKDGVLNTTMAIFFQELKEGFNTRKMLELLCASVEFKDEVPWRGKRDSEAMLELFKRVRERVQDKTGERLELPKKYSAAYCHKAFIIAHAHIFRVEIADPLLRQDAEYIIPKMAHLSIKGLMGITAAQHLFMPSVNCLEISRMFVQAVPSAWQHTESSELHQLPHLNAEQIKAIKTKKKQIKACQQLLNLSVEERQELFKALGLTESQSADLLQVARNIPRLSIVSAEFICKGEDSITPESLVTLVVRVKAITHDRPHAASKMGDMAYEDDGDSDGEFDAEEGGAKAPKVSKLTKILSGKYWMNPNDPVHCPYFPQLETEEQYRRPSYWMWLAAPRNNRVVGPPIRINKLVPVSVDEKDAEKGVKTVKFSFMAPPSPGVFAFNVFIDGDSYLGCDASRDVKLVVRPIEQVEIENRQKQAKDAWKDFDEEDKIDRELMANQPFMMGGAAARRPLDDSDESDDSSDSDSD